jgi:hypothetical protein
MVKTHVEQWDDAAAELRSLIEDGNLREMVALARELVEATRDALREHYAYTVEDDPEEADELSEKAARKLTGALDEIDEAEDDMIRAGWQLP